MARFSSMLQRGTANPRFEAILFAMAALGRNLQEPREQMPE